MPDQNFKNHGRYIPLWHMITPLIILVILGMSIINLLHTDMHTHDLHMWIPIILIPVVMLILWWYARAFALRAQDRAIRAEENFRHFGLLWGTDSDVHQRALAISNVGLGIDTLNRASMLRHRDYLFSREPGLKLRMTDITAAIIGAMFELAPQYRERRREIIERYDRSFSDLPLQLLKRLGTSANSYLMYVLRTHPAGAMKFATTWPVPAWPPACTTLRSAGTPTGSTGSARSPSVSIRKFSRCHAFPI